MFLVILATAFSSALPLALPLCAAYLLLRYLTERLYFVKYYKQTPAYDAKLFHAAYGLLPFALAAKLVATAVLYQARQPRQPIRCWWCNPLRDPLRQCSDNTLRYCG